MLAGEARSRAAPLQACAIARVVVIGSAWPNRAGARAKKNRASRPGHHAERASEPALFFPALQGGSVIAFNDSRLKTWVRKNLAAALRPQDRAPRRRRSDTACDADLVVISVSLPVLDAAQLASRLRNTRLRARARRLGALCNTGDVCDPHCWVWQPPTARAARQQCWQWRFAANASSQSACREWIPSTDAFEATSRRRYTSAFRTSASAAGLVASGELGGSRRRSCAQRLRGSRARRRPERSTASTRAVATAVDAVLTRAPVRPHPVAPASGAGLPTPPHRSRTPRTRFFGCVRARVVPLAEPAHLGSLRHRRGRRG